MVTSAVKVWPSSGVATVMVAGGAGGGTTELVARAITSPRGGNSVVIFPPTPTKGARALLGVERLQHGAGGKQRRVGVGQDRLVGGVHDHQHRLVAEDAPVGEDPGAGRVVGQHVERAAVTSAG